MEKRPNLYALTGSMFYFLSKDYCEQKDAINQNTKDKSNHQARVRQDRATNNKQL